MKEANSTHDFFVWREGMETWVKASDSEVFRMPPVIPAVPNESNPAPHQRSVSTLDRLTIPIPWRKLVVAACALIALMVVWNVGTGVVSQVRQQRREAEQQRVLAEAQKRESEEQRRQAEDPIMRARTKACWAKINAAESGLIEYRRSNVRVVDYFNRRAFVLSQIDVDDVDPVVVGWISASIENAKQWVAVSSAIEKEQRSLANFNEGVETLFSVVGVVVGAAAQNGQPVQDNMEIGRLAGDLAGKGSSFFVSALSNTDLEKRYGARVNGCQQQLEGLWQQRGQLAEWLTSKYQTKFFNPF